MSLTRHLDSFQMYIYRMMSNCKDYGFRDQIQRASVSIMNNIAEGLYSGYKSRFIFHLKVAKGSCAEIISMLYLCEDFKHCTKVKRIELQDQTKVISAGCQKLIESLKGWKDERVKGWKGERMKGWKVKGWKSERMKGWKVKGWKGERWKDERVKSERVKGERWKSLLIVNCKL